MDALRQGARACCASLADGATRVAGLQRLAAQRRQLVRLGRHHLRAGRDAVGGTQCPSRFSRTQRLLLRRRAVYRPFGEPASPTQCVASTGNALLTPPRLAQGGVFSLRLIFSEHYPEKPPRVRFTSEVFHPNGARGLPAAPEAPVHPLTWLLVRLGRAVYSDGTLCMDIIQDQWSPIHNVSTLLTSIQARLCAAEATTRATGTRVAHVAPLL